MNDQNEVNEKRRAEGQPLLNDGLRLAQMQRELLDAVKKLTEPSEPQKREIVPDDVVWLQIYCSVASSFNSEKYHALEWANNGLEEYKKKFKS